VLAEVQQTVDDVIVINRGRLVTSGPIGGLVTEGAVRVRSPRAAELAAALERDGADVTANGDAVEVKGRTTEQVGELAFSIGVPLHELTLETASLEDVFFRLTAEEPAP
jgi:ABC-2 type transport system ATP-binding protein